MWLEQLLTRGTQRAPDQICLRDLRRDVTWCQLYREARALASVLQSLTDRMDRVLLLSGNRVETIMTYFAGALAGVIVVPLNPALTDSELTYIIDAVSPAAVVADTVGRARLVDLNRSVNAVPIESVTELPDRPESTRGPARMTDPVVMFHTSATTGRPKGVVVDQRYLQIQALSWAAETRIAPSAVYLNASSLFHASVVFAFNYLAALGVVCILDAYTPRALINAVERWRVECSMLVPTMITLLLEERKAGTLKNSSLRSLISGGAPLHESLSNQARDVLGIPLRTIFGITEGGVVLHKWPEDGRTNAGHDGGICAGRPMPGYSVRIVGDHAELTRPDEIGLIQVACDGLMQGYWKNDGATAEIMHDGWLTTGDLGYQDADGFVWVIDRRLDLIVHGGQNVYPAEIERVLLQSSQVSQVCVVGAPSNTWGQTPVAFIESKGRELDTSELFALCAAELASYKRPSRFVLVDHLPRNATGKVLRMELRCRAASLGSPE